MTVTGVKTGPLDIRRKLPGKTESRSRKWVVK